VFSKYLHSFKLPCKTVKNLVCLKVKVPIAFNFEISKAYTVVRQVERNRNYKIRFFGKNKTSFLKLGFERAEDNQ